MENQEINYSEDSEEKNQQNVLQNNLETDITRLKKNEIDTMKIEKLEIGQNNNTLNNENQSYADEEFDFVEEEDNTTKNNVTKNDEKRSDEIILQDYSNSFKNEPESISKKNQENIQENHELNLDKNDDHAERIKCEQIKKKKFEYQSDLIVKNEMDNLNINTSIHNKTEVKEEFEFDFIEEPENDVNINESTNNIGQGKSIFRNETDNKNKNPFSLHSNIQEITETLIETNIINEEGENGERLIQNSNIEDNFDNKIKKNINQEEIFNFVNEENHIEITKKLNHPEQSNDKNANNLDENDEFDFYEAPEENKLKNLKNDIIISNNEGYVEELEKNNEIIDVPCISKEKELENVIELPETSESQIFEKNDDNNHKNNDNSDFEEVEKRFPTNDENNEKNEDSCSNKLKTTLLDTLKNETENSLQNGLEKDIEYKKENEDEGIMFSNQKKIIDDEIAIQHEIPKIIQINQLDNADDEFDFVEEKGEVSIDKDRTPNSKNNEINEKVDEYSIKNQDNSFKEAELAEKNENINPQFDSKKILEYSFSSSEDEEDQKNIKNKKITKSHEVKNSMFSQDSEFENPKSSVDINRKDNPDYKAEDELANLEYEDCSENSENIQENNKKKKNQNNDNNNLIIEEDIFDFVEEDNQEAKAQKIDDTSPIENQKVHAIKENETITNIENNDDEFDFVEEHESPHHSQTNMGPQTMNTKENVNNQINIDFRNKDYISNLINNYKSKFITNNPDNLFFDEFSIEKSLDYLTTQSNNTIEDNKKNNKNDSLNEVQGNEVSASKKFTFNGVSDKEEKDKNEVSNKESTNLNLDEHKVTYKEHTEDEEFLDVVNDLDDNKAENNCNELSPSNKTLNHFVNHLDYTMEIKMKKFKDLKNLNFEINESKYNYNNLDFSQQAMSQDKQQNNNFNQTISIKTLIDNLKFFKTEPEINIRGYSLEEINKLSKNYNTKLNTKNTIFNQNVMQISNEIMRNLFFQFSELKLINYNLQNQIHNSYKNVDGKSANNLIFINTEKQASANVEGEKVINPNKTEKSEIDKEDNFSSQKKKIEEINKNISNTKSNVSSINNKETLNTTINMNNISLNDNINKERILDNIKELKLLNEKNSDLFYKQKNNNNSSLSPSVNPNQQNYLSALNKEDSGKVKQDEKSPKLVSKSSGGIDLDSKKIKMEMKAQKALDSDSFDDIKDDDELSENENENKKPKFVMNEMMSSLFSASNNTQNTNFNLTKDLREEKKEDMSEEKNNEINENKMIEMLKSMGITKKEENSQSNKTNELERNNEKLNELINKLPNLNFLNSKYVEIPDSIFNI